MVISRSTMINNNNVCTQETKTLSLPDDVVLAEILPRLPTKSVLRFSCVAKSWNSMIFSHKFSKTHFQNLKNHSDLQHRVMLQSDSNCELKHFSLENVLNEPMAHVFDTKFHGVTNLPVISFVGSCNGLICIDLGQNGLVVFNPSIRKSKVLPDFMCVESGYVRSRCYGFGFDESADDYKVAGFGLSRCSYPGVLVNIYSLKTGETTRIKNWVGSWIQRFPPTFANGKLHWFVRMKQGEYEPHIAYLDLATEEYGILDISDFGQRKGHSWMMVQSGGSLYVYDHDSFRRDDDLHARYVWLIEPDYGVGRTTWTNLFSNHLHYGYFGKKIEPLFVLSEYHHDMVLLSRKKIKILNHNERSVRDAPLSSREEFLSGIAYVESLVHP